MAAQLPTIIDAARETRFEAIKMIGTLGVIGDALQRLAQLARLANWRQIDSHQRNFSILHISAPRNFRGGGIGGSPTWGSSPKNEDGRSLSLGFSSAVCAVLIWKCLVRSSSGCRFSDSDASQNENVLRCI